MKRQHYAPPPVSYHHLCEQMLSIYPSHKERPHLITLLVSEYLKLWRLTLGYSDKRIVTTGCILAVQEAHKAMGSDCYFLDCVAYFNRFIPRREWAWGGNTDIDGTLQTLRSYAEFFHDPPNEPWKEMTDAHTLKKAVFTVVH